MKIRIKWNTSRNGQKKILREDKVEKKLSRFWIGIVTFNSSCCLFRSVSNSSCWVLNWFSSRFTICTIDDWNCDMTSNNSIIFQTNSKKCVRKISISLNAIRVRKFNTTLKLELFCVVALRRKILRKCRRIKNFFFDLLFRIIALLRLYSNWVWWHCFCRLRSTFK